MKTIRLLLVATILSAVALTCLYFGPGSQAVAKGKPGGSPPPDGEVYFRAYDQDAQQWKLAVMIADGTSKTLLPAVPAESQPTYGLYGGVRWYLAFTETPGQFHPDGQPRGILDLAALPNSPVFC